MRERYMKLTTRETECVKTPLDIEVKKCRGSYRDGIHVVIQCPNMRQSRWRCKRKVHWAELRSRGNRAGLEQSDTSGQAEKNSKRSPTFEEV